MENFNKVNESKNLINKTHLSRKCYLEPNGLVLHKMVDKVTKNKTNWHQLRFIEYFSKILPNQSMKCLYFSVEKLFFEFTKYLIKID